MHDTKLRMEDMTDLALDVAMDVATDVATDAALDIFIYSWT